MSRNGTLSLACSACGMRARFDILSGHGHDWTPQLLVDLRTSAWAVCLEGDTMLVSCSPSCRAALDEPRPASLH